jgi:hypothetical protein
MKLGLFWAAGVGLKKARSMAGKKTQIPMGKAIAHSK